MNIVRRYREEFKLLFSSIQDSRFNDYWEQWIKRSTVTAGNFLRENRRLERGRYRPSELPFQWDLTREARL